MTMPSPLKAALATVYRTVSDCPSRLRELDDETLRLVARAAHALRMPHDVLHMVREEMRDRRHEHRVAFD